MLGWVNYCKGEEYFTNAKFYLKKSNEMASKIKYDQKYLDESLRAHIVELLEKLTDVESDDEDNDAEDKENMNSDEEYETDPEEEEEERKEHLLSMFLLIDISFFVSFLVLIKFLMYFLLR